MSKSLELPKGRYKCTKVKATKPGSFYITQGHKVIGEYSPVITVGERFMAEGMGFTDYVSTSIVTDFKMLPENKVEIHTEFSIYLLEELETPLKLTDIV